MKLTSLQHQATPSLLHNPSKGLSLGFIGGFALSFDIPLIRLAGSDPYMVMGVRGFALLIVLYFYGRYFADRSAMPKDLLADKYFITVGALSGLNNIFFVMAVFNTSTANVVFILAFNAMLAALLSWPLTGERPSVATWGAIVATLVGVGIIVSEGLGTGNLLGDTMALGCAILLALSLTITRRSGKDMSLAPGYGGLVSGAFALPMILFVSPMPEAPMWLLLDAFVLVPIAGICLWLAPRFIPAPQVSLFYLLETVLAPLWVWYVFNEVPSTNVFIGGSIVIGAITAHGLWELFHHRPRD
ncbi:MAG: DMT family transporter [Rhizobiaceae bacterium]